MPPPPNFGPPRPGGGPPPRFGGRFRGPGPGGFMPMLPNQGPPPPRGMSGPPFPGPFDKGFRPPMNQVPPGMMGPDMNGPGGPGGPSGPGPVVSIFICLNLYDIRL